ncbi:hypothetical protein LAZ67_4002941 [Cordylochernes scorpioides]|uniref:Uncharacterized protein n=1 Tax=Cordylochernes scorpioides TaxID=51811 RepID=A0ABY6KDG7_9ARAC|nr:hypothetical protein LAZ67_4002941 [Cordylochernes scorpioides]
MPPKKYNSEEERKATAAARRQKARQQETADQRAERLQRDAEAKRLHLSNETAEQRAARLLRNAEAKRLKLDSETADQRAARHQHPPDRKFSACCHKGKIGLPEQDYPEYLETLMNGVDHNSKKFMENIRSYNSSLAFASMGANIATPPGYGPYCFRIHGQIYHRTGTLHPVGEQPPKFAQLYILDTAEATRERLSIPENHGCDENVLNKLAELLEKHK